MNDREILQALLDGKIILVKEGTWHTFQYKLVGDKIWTKYEEDGWAPFDCIPELDSDYVEIVEEEE